MVEQIDVATVKLWGMSVGAVAWDPNRKVATFEFEPEFLKQGLDISPIKMPLKEALRSGRPFSFQNLSYESYKGLPGLLADSLPDKFGNALIDKWLAQQGRSITDFSPIERLCYTGHRGMGALEFEPVVRSGLEESVPVEISRLVELAKKITDERANFETNLNHDDALTDILRVSTSAGGARAKAVIALNDKTGEVRSGQVRAPKGFEYWLLKFDGVTDLELGKTQNYGRIEYAYHLMAKAAGIKMTECRLLNDNGRAHFLTKRYDRTAEGEKLHTQSLCAMAHFDFNLPRHHSYEQAFQVMRQLRLPFTDAVQQYRRTLFNIMARNQDDHTKNIAYLFDNEGTWSLTPAFDVTYAYNPVGDWTNEQQMTLNGKSDNFTLDDFYHLAKQINLKHPDEEITRVASAINKWPAFAKKAGVPDKQFNQITQGQRQDLITQALQKQTNIEPKI